MTDKLLNKVDDFQKKRRVISVRSIGTLSDTALAAFAKLLLSRANSNPALTVVSSIRKKGILSRP